MALPQYSHEDKALLEGLAGVHRAVGNAPVRRACEQFRDALLRQHDRLAIGAEALRLCLQEHGNGVYAELEGPEWKEFFLFAEDIERTKGLQDGSCSRQADSARTASFRHLRATARLTALWDLPVLEHYGFTHWNLKKLENLCKCADTLRDFRDFVHVANFVLLQRHEGSLTSNRIDRIGQHTATNQYASTTTSPRSDQPLQNKDITRILNLILGSETATLDGRQFDSYEQVLEDRSRVDEWVQDETGEIIVAGMTARDYHRFRSANYYLQHDMYDLLVPREQGNSLQPRDVRERKRQRLSHITAARVESGIRRTASQAKVRKPLALVKTGPRVPVATSAGPSGAETPDPEQVNPCWPSVDFPPTPAPNTYALPTSVTRGTTPAHVAMATFPVDSPLRSEAQILPEIGPQPAVSRLSRHLQNGGISDSGPRVSPATSSSNERWPHTFSRVDVPPRVSDLPASAIRESSMLRETVTQSPAFDPDIPMVSEFEEQFASHMFSVTSTDEARKVCPLQKSLGLIDSDTPTLFDLTNIHIPSPSVSGSPHSFSSLLTMSSGGSPLTRSSPRPGSPRLDHSEVTLVEPASALESPCTQDPLAQAWLKLPELLRHERLDPFRDASGRDVVYVATQEQIQAAVHSGFKFEKPIVTKCGFIDSHVHTPERFADNLRRLYPKDEHRFSFHDGQMRSMTSRQLAEMIEDRTREPRGIFEVGGALSKSHIAPFLLNWRFRLLDALTERTKRETSVWKGSQSQIFTKVDSMQFGMLSFPGAFLPPHIDNTVGSQLRVLFGKQSLGMVPYNGLTDEERAEFVLAGQQWCPPSHKGQVVPLEGDDVMLVPSGVKIIRAVFTEELCLTEGGCVWDFLAVKEIMLSLLDVMENPTHASGPFPTRLLDELESWASDEPELFTNGNEGQLQSDLRVIFGQLRAMGCACAECRPGHCSCAAASRQCTEWCRSHEAGSDCMLPDPGS